MLSCFHEYCGCLLNLQTLKTNAKPSFPSFVLEPKTLFRDSAAAGKAIAETVLLPVPVHLPPATGPAALMGTHKQLLPLESALVPAGLPK